MSLPACVDAYIDGEADDAQLAELTAWLRADPEHPRAFMRALRLHHALRDEHVGAVSVAEPAVAAHRPALRVLPRRGQRPRPAQVLALVAAACLVLGVFGHLAASTRGGAPVADTAPVIAEIGARAADAVIWRAIASGAGAGAGDAALAVKPRAADDWRAARASAPAAADARVRSGDVVENRGDAVVTVSFLGEATRISLRPHAIVAFLDGWPGKLVVLHAGAFDAVAARQAPGRPLECVGRWATATVVGTVFSVIDAGSTTRLEVAEGRVRFTPTVRPAAEPIEIEVGAGEFAMAGPTNEDLVRPRPDRGTGGPAITSPAAAAPAPTIWGAYWSRWKHGLPADPAFFPIAVWQQEPMHAQAYRDIGVNLYVGLWGGPTEEQLSALGAAGMRVICSQNAVGLAHRDDPLIVGWTYDATPDNAQDPAVGAARGEFGSSIEPSAVADACDAMAAADPMRPIHMTFGPGVAYTPWTGRGHSTGMTDLYPRYIRSADILSFDIYPLNAVADDLREVRGDLWYVALGIDHLQAWTREADPRTPKPAWAMIECTRITADGRQPTSAQVRSEAWMALIHGAAGICWFCHTFGTGRDDTAAALHDPAVTATIEAIDREILALAPALNAPTVAEYARVAGADADVPIDAMAKRVGGETYLFTASMRGKATTAAIELPGPARVEVLGEQRAIDAPQGSFHDTYAPYGVHLYRIVSAARQAPAIPSPIPSPKGPEGPVVPPRP